MAVPSFIFGGNTGDTPESIKRKREIANALAKGALSNSPKDVGSGLSAIGQALLYRKMMTDADKAETGFKSEAQADADALIGGFGGTGSANPSSASGGAYGGAIPLPGAAGEISSKPVDISGDRQTFVDTLLPAAIEEGKRTGIDPRIIVAQAAQETGWGKSAPGNNFFGIKSHGQDGGNSLMTTEYVNGQPVKMRDSFRAYENPQDSVRGYGDFMLQNPRYKPLREAKGLDEQLSALQASGYATDPNYSRSVGAIARGIKLPTEVASLDPSAGMTAADAINAIAPTSQQSGPESAYIDPAVKVVNPVAEALAKGGNSSTAVPPSIAQALANRGQQRGATVGDPSMTYDENGARMDPEGYNRPQPQNPYSGPGAQVGTPMPVYDEQGMSMQPPMPSASAAPSGQLMAGAPGNAPPLPPPQAIPPQPPIAAPQQPQGQPQAIHPPQPSQAHVDVAQAAQGDMGQGYFPAAPNAPGQSGPSMRQIMRVLQNPYSSPEVKAIAAQQLERMQQANDPAFQQQQQLRQMQMEKTRLELDQAKNPRAKYDYTTLPDGTVLRTSNLGGAPEKVYESGQKPTDDMREYDFAKSQGFTGTFTDFQQQMKKAGASTTNVNVGEGDKFYENLDKKNAETFASMSDTGIQARAKIAQIDRLQGLMANAPQGAVGVLKQAAGELGIATDGLSDIQAASALLEKMVPEQRAPGSGTMSDADIKMFRASLPRILNQPGGNQLIFDTMRGIAQYEMQMGEIADQVADRAIKPEEGRKLIRELRNPLADFKPPEGQSTPNEGRKTSTGATWSIDE